VSLIGVAVQLLAVAAGVVVYLRRWRRVRADRGPGAASGWRFSWCLGAAVVLLVAVAWPIAPLAQRNVTFHIAQHILVFDAAPILIVCSLTVAIVEPVVGRLAGAPRWARALLRHPVVLVGLYGLTLWIISIPLLFNAALDVPALHVLQHLALLSVGVVFWWQELAPAAFRRTGQFTSVFYLVAGKMLSGVVASVLVFWPSVLYDHYLAQEPMFGLGALDAQRMAGGILILVEGIIFLTAVGILMVRLLSESGHGTVDPID